VGRRKTEGEPSALYKRSKAGKREKGPECPRAVEGREAKPGSGRSSAEHRVKALWFTQGGEKSGKKGLVEQGGCTTPLETPTAKSRYSGTQTGKPGRQDEGHAEEERRHKG